MQYIKLSEYNYIKNCFPLDVAGVFSDGHNHSSIILPLQGTLLLETNKTITEGDKELKAILSIKNLPSGVVVIL